MPSASPAETFRRALRRPRRRLRALRGLRWLSWGLLATGLAEALLHLLASRLDLALPLAPWPAWAILATGGGLGLALGLSLRVRSTRALHAVDRAAGLAELLLSAHEIAEGRASPHRPAYQTEILASATSALIETDLRAALPLKPVSALGPAAGGVTALLLALLLPPPDRAPLPASALASILPAEAPAIPEAAPLRRPEDLALSRQLQEQISRAREREAFGAGGDALLDDMEALARKLREGRLPPNDALARLRHLQARARAAGEEAREAAIGKRPARQEADQNVEEIARRIATTARKILEDHGERPEASAPPSALVEALARLAERLLRENPAKLEELARRLSRGLASRGLRGLLDRRYALRARLERLARGAGRGRRLRRQIRRLEDRLRRNEQKVARLSRAQRPGLERLRRDLEAAGRGDQKGDAKGQQRADPGGKEGRQGARRQGRQQERQAMKGRKGSIEEPRPGEPRRREGRHEEGPGGRKGGRSPGTRRASRTARTLEDLRRMLRGQESRRALRRGMAEMERRLRRETARRSAERRMARLRRRGRRGRQARLEPSRLARLRPGGSGPRGSTPGEGRRSGSAGRPGGGSGRPGTEHKRGRPSRGRSLKGRVREHLVGPEGKPGAFARSAFRGTERVGGAGRSAPASFDASAVDDALRHARVPERYRANIRTYFGLLEGLASGQAGPAPGQAGPAPEADPTPDPTAPKETSP